MLIRAYSGRAWEWLENGWKRAFFAHKMAALFKPFSANKKSWKLHFHFLAAHQQIIKVQTFRPVQCPRRPKYLNDLERGLFKEMNDISVALAPLEKELACLISLPQPLQGSLGIAYFIETDMQKRKAVLESEIANLKKKMKDLKESKVNLFHQLDGQIGEQRQAELEKVLAVAEKFEQIKVFKCAIY
jgi:hypothetical protein